MTSRAALETALVLGLFLFYLTLYSRFDQVEVKAANGYPVHNIDTGLNYTSIQGAIDAPETSNGHRIFVESRTYYEHFVVNKSLSLIGENGGTTIIDGNGTGVVVDPVYNITAIVEVAANNVNISGFTIRNGGFHGIVLYGVANCTINQVASLNSSSCISLMNSTRNRILNSMFSGGTWGIFLFNSTENDIVSNMATENLHAGIASGGPEGSSKNLIANNTLSHNVLAGSNIYGIGLDLVGSDNEISFNNISNNTNGIILDHANSNQLKGNVISNNTNWGIWIWYGFNNTFFGNTIQQSGSEGLLWDYGTGNTIHHNNFVDNNYQVGYLWYLSDWDDGIEGNYWSDYTGKDSNNDGIGDTPYTIYEFGRDNHPLMGRFSSFNAIQDLYVNVISNSTIESFHYFELNNTIKMRVSNMTANQLFGFVRIRIPHALMSEPYNVTINGINPNFWNYTLYDDGENRWIYFNYEHSTLEIIIIPEFPLFLIIPPFMIATLLMALICKKKKIAAQHVHY
jgi:parallel beta-helix repeat protein